MERHAYLITAYNNFAILKKLLYLLDDARNDIYIHVDKRVKRFDPEPYLSICRYSAVTFVPRVKVYWGDYTQIISVYHLLEAAALKNYRYYHLLSGTDLPIKTQNAIHAFFQQNDGREFVGFAKTYNDQMITKIHILNRFNKAKILRIPSKLFLAKPFVLLQCLFRYDRTKKSPYAIRKGSDWFSISDAFAKYVIRQKEQVLKVFRYAYIPTELYVQTLLWNSRFRENVYDSSDEFKGSLRHIDWERGNPYTFRSGDFEELMNCDELFARKFDENIDPDIVNRIAEHIGGQQEAERSSEKAPDAQ